MIFLKFQCASLTPAISCNKVRAKKKKNSKHVLMSSNQYLDVLEKKDSFSLQMHHFFNSLHNAIGSNSIFFQQNHWRSRPWYFSDTHFLENKTSFFANNFANSISNTSLKMKVDDKCELMVILIAEFKNSSVKIQIIN